MVLSLCCGFIIICCGFIFHVLWSHNYKTAVGIDLFVSCGTKILGPGHNPGSGQSPGGVLDFEYIWHDVHVDPAYGI